MLAFKHLLTKIEAAGIIAALICGLIIALAGGDTLRRPVFDLWARANLRNLSESPVRIVWIDEASIKTIGAWPWSRYELARLTEKIAVQEPSVIGFDMLFPEPDRISPEGFLPVYPQLSNAAAAEVAALESNDVLFSRVIGKSPVVLARAGISGAPPKSPPVLTVSAQLPKALPDGLARWPAVLTSIPLLDDVALGHGLINGEPDSDGTVRHVPLIGRAAGTAMPGFALELARLSLGEDAVSVDTGGGGVRRIGIGTRFVLSDAQGRMRVPYGELPGSAQLSAIDLMYDFAPEKALAGKIVIVGLSGTGTADLVTTPLGGQDFGAKVQAATIDAILNGKSLYRPWWAAWIEAAMAIAMVGLAVHYLPRTALPRAGVVGAIVAGAAVAISAISYLAAGWLIDPAGPIGVAGAASATVIVLITGAARLAQARAEAELLEQRVTAAKAAGELAAARSIQLGMLPPRSLLARLDTRVETDALIEPARSIGGDFYDAVRIDPHRICFLVGDVTGKGVPAALFMALSKALTKSVLLRDGSDLGAAVTRINDEIARDNSEDMFVTMLFGLIDLRSGALTLCNAGHENPYLIRADGTLSQLSPDGGPPLSVMPGFIYTAETVHMASGDCLFILSDGLTEAQNTVGAFFGSDRIEQVLTSWSPGTALSGANEALLRAVRRFEDGTEATDDLTILGFRYLT